MPGSLKDNSKQFNYGKKFYEETAVDKAIAALEAANNEDSIIKYREQINILIKAVRENQNA